MWNINNEVVHRTAITIVFPTINQITPTFVNTWCKDVEQLTENNNTGVIIHFKTYEKHLLYPQQKKHVRISDCRPAPKAWKYW